MSKQKNEVSKTVAQLEEPSKELGEGILANVVGGAFTFAPSTFRVPTIYTPPAPSIPGLAPAPVLPTMPTFGGGNPIGKPTSHSTEQCEIC